MAASLDEIQGYDLLQTELERSLENFLRIKDSENPFMVSFTVNALIEYACFNLYLESWEQFDLKFVNGFREWYLMFSGEEVNLMIVSEFLDFTAGIIN
jgi:hypothetical protein